MSIAEYYQNGKSPIECLEIALFGDNGSQKDEVGLLAWLIDYGVV